MENEERTIIAGIEAGGTKWVCAVAHDAREPLKELRFPTEDPETTLRQAVEFFAEMREEYGSIRSMGIGTFGPADIHPKSPGYGSILTTPKQGWAGFNVVQAIREGLGDPFPVVFETDVNAALIGEVEHGAARNLRYAAYITVGTGIGGGFIHDGEIVRGRMHPEIGHMVVPDFDRQYGKNTNVCPFHSSCLEGRACGPAIEARWGKPGHELPDDHEAWDLEAAYMAAGCISLTAAWSPEIIILGGGVFQNDHLIRKVRAEFEKQAGNYWSLPPMEDYLQLPGLGQQAGIVGALTMAQRLL